MGSFFQMCKTPECAFDLGDCGVGIVKQELPEVDVVPENGTLRMPSGQFFFLLIWFMFLVIVMS